MEVSWALLCENLPSVEKIYSWPSFKKAVFDLLIGTPIYARARIVSPIKSIPSKSNSPKPDAREISRPALLQIQRVQRHCYSAKPVVQPVTYGRTAHKTADGSVGLSSATIRGRTDARSAVARIYRTTSGVTSSPPLPFPSFRAPAF